MDYNSASSCLQTLQELNTSETLHAHTVLQRMVSGLFRSSLSPQKHLEVLEAARSLVYKVQADFMAQYALNIEEDVLKRQAALMQAFELWRNLGRSYIHVARMAQIQGVLMDKTALLVQRRTHAFGAAIIECSRAHHVLPSGLWAQLHESYLEAESLNIARVRVPDPINVVWGAESAEEAYVAVLLIFLTQPGSQDSVALNWIIHLAQQFAPYCGVKQQMDGERIAYAFGIDMDGDEEPRAVPQLEGATCVRYLDGGELIGSLHTMRAEIRRGSIPSGLGFMAEKSQDRLLALVSTFYRPWVSGSIKRKHARREGRALRASLLTDWRSICVSILSSSGLPPEPERMYERIHEGSTILPDGILGAQTWAIMDQSVGGFRLQSDVVRGALEAKQLIALRPEDGNRFLLAQVRWVKHGVNSGTEVGVRLLPGQFQGVSVRRAALDNSSFNGAFLEGMLMTATENGVEAESLILPKGCYAQGASLEMKMDSVSNVKSVVLGKLLLSGSNFDQVEYRRLG